MKKLLSISLAAMMLLSTTLVSFGSSVDHTSGTEVTYIGAATEQFTVTVPATLEPGEEGEVVAEGTWTSNRRLVVTADETVTLTNSLNSDEQKILNIEFDGIDLAGSNTVAVEDTQTIEVEDITDALFGTWSGHFDYEVDMVDVAITPEGMNEYGFYYDKEYNCTESWVFFEDGSREIWMNGEHYETSPAGTCEYEDTRVIIRVSDNQSDSYSISSDGLSLGLYVYMDGYDNGSINPTLNEYGFYFEEFYGSTATYILHEDGTGCLYILGYELPGEYSIDETGNIIFGNHVLSISNNGTVLSEPGSELKFVLE